MGSVEVRVRRIYEPASRGDGMRVLVDRIWPRGVSKQRAHLDEWCKDAAPSTDLRKWYGHDPARFTEFSRRYRRELKEPEAAQAVSRLKTSASKRTLTLLTATKDVEISAATVLAGVLRD